MKRLLNCVPFWINTGTTNHLSMRRIFIFHRGFMWNKLWLSVLLCWSDIVAWSHRLCDEAWKGRARSLWMEAWWENEELSASPHFGISAHKRSIYSETYPETVRTLSRFPVYTDPMLESSHASSRGKWVRGERLNNALIQLVRLETHNAPLSALAQAGLRQRKGGEDRKSN